MREVLLGVCSVLVFLLVLWFSTIIFPPRVHFETKIKTTNTIPATEWKCEINANTNEITCKGVMK